MEKLPFLALTAASCALTYHWALRHGNTISAEDLPWGFRLANVPVSYAQYLGKMIWPMDLSVVYPMPSHWAWWQTGGAVFLLVMITLLVLWRARSAPYGLVGWLVFLGMLVPTLRLAQAGFQSIADRYTYLPSIGLFIAVVWGGCELLNGLGSSRRIGSALAGLAAIVLCLVLTRLQLGYWKDSETLFRHALAVTEDNYIMHINLGTTLAERGQADEAISHYREALRLNPDFAIAHNSLALALGRRGQTDEAIRQFQEAIRLKPNYADAHNNLGYALSLKGQADEAISQYRQALHFNPADASAHNNLGIAFARKGQLDEAIRQFQEASRLNPADADAHNNLGSALARKGRMDEAISQFQEVLRLKPDYAEVHNVLGFTLLRRGLIDEAISQFQEALRLKPDFAIARKYLNAALAAQAAASKPPGPSTNP